MTFVRKYRKRLRCEWRATQMEPYVGSAKKSGGGNQKSKSAEAGPKILFLYGFKSENLP